MMTLIYAIYDDTKEFAAMLFNGRTDVGRMHGKVTEDETDGTVTVKIEGMTKEFAEGVGYDECSLEEFVKEVATAKGYTIDKITRL